MNEKVLEAKKAVVNELNEHLKNSKCAIIVTYHSLPVSLLTEVLKSKLVLSAINIQLGYFLCK